MGRLAPVSPDLSHYRRIDDQAPQWLDRGHIVMAKRHGPRTPVVLIVLDGWGFRPGREGNAVQLGRTPTWHRLWAKAPRTLLDASGLAVGLPKDRSATVKWVT